MSAFSWSKELSSFCSFKNLKKSFDRSIGSALSDTNEFLEKVCTGATTSILLTIGYDCACALALASLALFSTTSSAWSAIFFSSLVISSKISSGDFLLISDSIFLARARNFGFLSELSSVLMAYTAYSAFSSWVLTTISTLMGWCYTALALLPCILDYLAPCLLLFDLGNLADFGMGFNFWAAFSRSLLIASKSPSTLYSFSARLLTLNSFC